MIAEERRKIILERIQDNKSVSVQELSKEFGITGVTIRRDLDLLDQQGLVKRSHGGAVIIDQNVGVESGFEARRGRKMEIKEMIGRKAAGMVAPGDCIGIDIGTTVYEMSQYVKHIEDVTVVTASIPVVTELMNAKNVNVICTGGEVSRKDQSLIGHNAIRTINEYILDKVFIGVAGISFDCGLTLFNMNDTLVKRALIKRAREVIVLADSSKIGLTKHAFFCDLEAVDKLIIDKGISEKDKLQLEGCGIEVIIADGENSDEVEDIS